jgi:NitT/TauT family transport system substrate-binding protein
VASACDIAGPGGKNRRTGSKSVTVGVIPIVDVAPLYLGIQKGFFSQRGLDITPKPAQGGAFIIPIVLSQQYQVGFSNVVSLLGARDRGIGLVSVAAGVSSTGLADSDFQSVVVGPNSPLQSAKDLAGRTVAVNSLNNIGDTTVRTAVARAGGDPTKVKFAEMPFPEMAPQLQKGAIDAVWVTEPFRSAILGTGGRVLFNNLTATYSRVQVAQWFVTEDIRAKDPEMVAAFVAGINESMKYATDHPAEVRAILSTYTKITPEVATKMVLPTWPIELDVESTKTLGDYAQNNGTLKNPPDVSGLLASP